MLKIGDFSKLSRISIRMLRHYDELGLLVPKTTDDFTGYRYYAEDQLTVAGRIVSLKDMGFSLSVIGEIMQKYHDPQALAGFLEVKYAEVKAEAVQTRQRMLLLETAMERLRKDETAMNYNVTLKTLPKRHVASVRQVIPAYQEEGLLWKTLMQETTPLNLQPDNTGHTLAIFHDKSHKESNVDVEIQMDVRGSYHDTEHVVFKTEPEVEIASATYRGSYEQLIGVNHAVAEWIRDNGYDFDGAMFLIYHVGPDKTQNPDEYVTEVCYPIRKK